MRENEQKRRCTQRELGSRYESIAASYLETQGYRIIARNYYTKRGEIDLIAMEDEILVFVEVKYRSDEKKGDPLAAVRTKKQSRICRAALVYLTQRGIAQEQDCRFDVVGILGEQITLIRNAFEFQGL